MTAAAPRFAPNPRRRALIAKVKLAQKELGLVDDDYRAVLLDVTGRTSAADCSEAELVRVVERFKARGFQPKPAAGRGGSPRAADHPAAKKARALWISLHHLGAIDDPSERALEAFARRQLGVERLQWADQAKAYKLIEALKAMGERKGWRQDLAGIDPAAQVMVLKRRLAEAILARLKTLGIAARHWSLTEAAWLLLGERPASPGGIWEFSELDRIAAGLGAKLRAARPGGRR